VRILAIRGHNLASLARTFEVDLAAGPLRGTGLFAITGPVGAGKTTLLDAMCLALFDRTPRLNNRGGALVGDQGEDRGDWLRGNDPRTLLRRDAAEGSAEVDFLGRDGVRYRAIWCVRRARRRPDGRVQDQEMSLVDLDRNAVVAKGRKTEVLAAIEARLGLDFAQFCRSVLLAQGEFSAFLKAPADERARLLERLTGADVYRKLSRAAHERRKHEEQRAGLLRSQFEAQQLLEPDARKVLEGERARFEDDQKACGVAVELAQRYVNWYAAAAQRQKEEADATVELRKAVERNDTSAERRQRLAKLQAALGLAAPWRHAQQRLADKATCEKALAGAERALAKAEAEARAARAALGPELQALFGLDEAPPVVRELPRWEPLLERRLDAEARVASLARAAPRLAASEQQAAAELPAAREVQRARAADRERAEEAAKSAEEAANAPALRKRASRRKAWTVRTARVRDLSTLFDQLTSAHTPEGLAALREQLADGEPCPLCGSLEHPAAGQPADVGDAVTHGEEWRRAIAGDAELAAATSAAAVRAVLAARREACAAEEHELLALDEQARERTDALREAVKAAARAHEAWAASSAAEQQAARRHAEAADAVAQAAKETQRLREEIERQVPALAEAFRGVRNWQRDVARHGADLLPRLRRAHGLDAALRTAEQGIVSARSEHDRLATAAERAGADADAAATALAAAAQESDASIDDVAEAVQLGAKHLAAQAGELAALARRVDELRAVLGERVAQRKKHEEADRPALDEAEARDALALASRRRDEAQKQLIEVGGRLASDDRARRQREEIAPRLEAAEEQFKVWRALDDLIGSSSGDAFSVFAQGVTLDLLLLEANHRLAELARRYRLEKNADGDMDFVVVDLDLGGSRRALQTLSGGETFLVSLALALALATLAAPKSRVETLFLDEGFGTLDAQNLETALGALDTLQASGCQVGIISHVDGIAERIGACVEVLPEGGGRSRVLLKLR
jgi:exonuclease SbcC